MPSAGAALEIQEQGTSLPFLLKGRLDSETTGTVWRKAFKAIENSTAKLRTLDAAGAWTANWVPESTMLAPSGNGAPGVGV